MARRLQNAPLALLPAPLQLVPPPAAASDPASQIQQLYFLREAVDRAKKTLDRQRSDAIAAFLTVAAPVAPDTPLPIGQTVDAYKALVKNESDLKAQSDSLDEIDELAAEALAYFKREDNEEVIKFLEAQIKELRKKTDDLGKPYADLAKGFEYELNQLRNRSATFATFLETTDAPPPTTAPPPKKRAKKTLAKPPATPAASLATANTSPKKRAKKRAKKGASPKGGSLRKPRSGAVPPTTP